MAHNVVLFFLFICQMITSVGTTVELLDLEVEGHLSLDPADTLAVSSDFGGMTNTAPIAVLRPASASDISTLIHYSYLSSSPFPVSARGHGHSINGQARATNGVVIEMSNCSTASKMAQPVYSPILQEYYVDVWGGALWVNVLNWTLEHGWLAPKTWTDYLYLSVGGTLSNGGVSGQTFHHGPQISNVYELDVITGKGEFVTCSENQRPELFFGVLGGLGQFGIITRARIALEPAPQRVRWIRVLYPDFDAFTRDQERLISLHGAQRFDYVEGSVIIDSRRLINNWRSPFFSPPSPAKIRSVGANGSILYCMEITKNYDKSTADTVDQEVGAILKELKFIPSTVSTSDLPYFDFLNRVNHAELKLRESGLWDVPHPWLILFVPASQIAEFDRGVFRGILGNNTSGPILIYPVNKHKWDDRSSAVTPEEEAFYVVGFLWTTVVEAGESTRSLEYLSRQNERILEFCQKAGIQVKQYLPRHKSREEWQQHFGPDWDRFLRLKDEFDPKYILGTGQGIFHPSSSPSSSLLPS